MRAGSLKVLDARWASSVSSFPSPGAPFQQRDPSFSFGDALRGSSLGIAVGGSLGVLLLHGATNDAAWEDERERARDSDESCCALKRIGIGLAGVGLIAGSGPVGAAQRLGAGGEDFYGHAVTAELLFGGLGYAIGSGLGQSDRQKTVLGLALGFSLGALGTALGARFHSNTSSESGVLQVQDGHWSAGVPQVRLRPHVTVDRPPVIHISLFSAEL